MKKIYLGILFFGCIDMQASERYRNSKNRCLQDIKTLYRAADASFKIISELKIDVKQSLLPSQVFENIFNGSSDLKLQNYLSLKAHVPLDEYKKAMFSSYYDQFDQEFMAIASKTVNNKFAWKQFALFYEQFFLSHFSEMYMPLSYKNLTLELKAQEYASQ
ncbi:MAG: hypothetical protein ACOYT8_03890 [Candidatus Dependentiae bacterium]